jgi:hypothetical protein
MAGINDIKGKNKLSSKKLFDNRTNYRHLAFATDQSRNNLSYDTLIPPGSMDFWWRERGFYGKVSSNIISEPIEAFTPYLRPLPSKKSSIRVMHFVADAFKAFQQRFLLDIRNGDKGLLADDPMLSDITPTKGYVSVSNSYRNYQKETLASFINHMKSNDIAKNILNMEDFLRELTHYIINLHTKPFTRSGFILSRYSSPLTSGLCIELKDLPYSEDEKKIEFINSPNFKHYHRLANEYGFAIDKNVPWRLVAHIDSDKMQEYARAYDSEIASVDDIINKFYVQVALGELEDLKLYLATMYNQFVIDNPASVKETHSHSSSTRTINTRSKITMEDLNSCYSDCRWLELYIKVRNRETGLNYSGPAEKAIIRVAKDTQKTFDTKEAMSYIKIKFSGVEFYEGSLRHEIERSRQAASSEQETTPIESVRTMARKDRKIFF